MNALHLACFCQCRAFAEIDKSLCEGILNTQENQSKLDISSSTLLKPVITICKSAMEEKTKESKETPENLAATYGDITALQHFQE